MVNPGLQGGRVDPSHTYPIPRPGQRSSRIGEHEDHRVLFAAYSTFDFSAPHSI